MPKRVYIETTIPSFYHTLRTQPRVDRTPELDKNLVVNIGTGIHSDDESRRDRRNSEGNKCGDPKQAGVVKRSSGSWSISGS